MDLCVCPAQQPSQYCPNVMGQIGKYGACGGLSNDAVFCMLKPRAAPRRRRRDGKRLPETVCHRIWHAGRGRPPYAGGPRPERQRVHGNPQECNGRMPRRSDGAGQRISPQVKGRWEVRRECHRNLGLIFLPPHTPQLNPAEMQCSTLKWLLSGRYFVSVDELKEPIASLANERQMRPVKPTSHMIPAWQVCRAWEVRRHVN